MRFVVAALVALFVFVPAAPARAQPPAQPTIDAPAKDAVNQRPVTLAGTTEPGTTLVVSDGGAVLDAPVVTGGAWILTLDLPDGVHEIKAVATNATGESSEAVRRITIDTEAPDAVEPVQAGTSEFTFAGEAGAALQGGAGRGGVAACQSPPRPARAGARGRTLPGPG